MIKYNIERKIKFSDILKIIFNKRNPKNLLKRWFPKKEILFTNYGRSAFEIILKEYKIKNCKVMIPAFICPLFKEIFEKRNIQPILIDVEMDTFNISEKTLKKNFDKEAKCLIVNNMNGLPCDLEKIKKVSKSILLIEDCAHSLGAKHKGKRVGNFGNSAFFSLYKNLPTVSGGFAVSKKNMPFLDPESVSIKMWAKLLYYLGNNANLYKSLIKKNKSAQDDLDFEEVKILGPNKIVKKLFSKYVFDVDNIIKKRRQIAKKIISGLSDSNLKFQEDADNEHIYTYFSFLLSKETAKKRDDLIIELQKRGIVARIIWKNPLSKILYAENCPNSKEISSRIVNIPLSIGYSKKDIKYIIESIKESLSSIS